MMKRSEIAAIFGVDASSVSRWRFAGCPCTDDGEYDENCVRTWLRTQDRKPTPWLDAQDRRMDAFLELNDKRLQCALDLGLAIDDDSLLCDDVRESISLCFQLGRPEAGLKLLRDIISVLQNLISEYGQEVAP